MKRFALAYSNPIKPSQDQVTNPGAARVAGPVGVFVPPVWGAGGGASRIAR
jgi:hypothetical protein